MTEGLPPPPGGPAPAPPGGPAPAPPGGPAPAPPGAPDPGWAERFAPPTPTADVAAYLRANSTRYTREALDQRLLAAGYPTDAIAAAWAAFLAEEAAGGRRDRRGQTAALIGGAYLITWIVVVVFVIIPNPQLTSLDDPVFLAIILGVALLVPCLLAVAVALAGGWLRHAGLGRVVAFSFVPLLILFALAGTCVAAVRPF